MTIPLIDKLDNFEIVDLQIAAILAQATIDQQALAASGGEDPELWEFDVFSERFNPIFEFQDNPHATPIVNTWYDTSSFNPSKGTPNDYQTDDATYNIDIYAGVAASDNAEGGHNPGDYATVKELHRIARLVRNIIMHPDNTNLQLKQIVNGKEGNLVGRRWITGKELFQPQIGDRFIENTMAMRIPLSVSFPETPVKATFPELEVVGIVAKRAEDGKIILEADFDTTP